MPQINDETIEQIVAAVVDRVRGSLMANAQRQPGHASSTPASPSGAHRPSPVGGEKGTSPSSAARADARAPAFHRRDGRRGVFEDLDDAVAASRKAYEQYEAMPLATRYDVVAAMRKVALAHLDEMANRAVDETKLGRVEDKLVKNRVAITKTPGPEFLEPVAASGDDGLMITERAPFGVICSITPCTNPTETIINNGLGMVAGGNAVLFNVHPLAKGTSAWYIDLLNGAIESAGGPPNLLSCIAEPTVESAGKAMTHPGVRLVVVTGGGEVVRAAMRSGKRAVSAGPGNPPVVVDETADLQRAARGIIAGASFDNNVICTDEKEIVAVSDIADRLRDELVRQGAYLLSSADVRALEKTLLDAEKHINRGFVGKNASVLLKSIGKSIPDSTRLLFAELDEEHPFVQNEMLMPIVGLVRASDVDAAIACAKRVEHGYGHTAVMYSTNIENLSRMARAINTSIFVKNAPNFAGIGAGGEGYTSWTIASPTGEGLTTCRTFTRERRCTLKDYFRIV
ncbi:MAG: aldehyde dehydrogenase EutE [Deltaproteobacteria bacterium]|nr:aldehyde dehydrogenase EutE [Deltaproteobacteria bacterium]